MEIPVTLAPVATDEVGRDDAEEEFQSLDPRHIRADQIASLIFAAVVTAGLLTGLVIAWFAGSTGWLLWLFCGLATGLSVFLFVLGFLWPPLEYRHTGWRITRIGLEIRRGVVWRHRISIPIARVQHADVSQGPLQRSFGLGKLTVHTAGTQNASVELTGLSHPTAIELRDQVVRQQKATDVV